MLTYWGGDRKKCNGYHKKKNISLLQDRFYGRYKLSFLDCSLGLFLFQVINQLSAKPLLSNTLLRNAK